MALLKHPNVVELIGVVSTPRSMPALMLMTYCEHGSLLDFVITSETKDVDTSLLLSFCADVAAGMSYLSSRRIVHNDVGSSSLIYLPNPSNCVCYSALGIFKKCSGLVTIVVPRH